MKINTDLVAHSEHIADDLTDTLSEVGLEITGAQFDKLVEFVQSYIEGLLRRCWRIQNGLMVNNRIVVVRRPKQVYKLLCFNKGTQL